MHTAEDRLTFVPLPEPTDEEVDALALKVARQVTAAVERLCADTFETDALLEQTATALQQALATAVRAPVPGAKPVAADDRDGLERLCRYGLRPPFSQDRLTLRADGRVLALAAMALGEEYSPALADPPAEVAAGVLATCAGDYEVMPG